MARTTGFFRPPSERISEGPASTSPRGNKKKAEGISADTIEVWVLEFIGKTGVNVDNYTLGQVLDMIHARDEEIQIGWACAAQSPDLLPQKYKKKGSKKTASFIKAVFEE